MLVFQKTSQVNGNDKSGTALAEYGSNITNWAVVVPSADFTSGNAKGIFVNNGNPKFIAKSDKEFAYFTWGTFGATDLTIWYTTNRGDTWSSKELLSHVTTTSASAHIDDKSTNSAEYYANVGKVIVLVQHWDQYTRNYSLALSSDFFNTVDYFAIKEELFEDVKIYNLRVLDVSPNGHLYMTYNIDPNGDKGLICLDINKTTPTLVYKIEVAADAPHFLNTIYRGAIFASKATDHGLFENFLIFQSGNPGDTETTFSLYKEKFDNNATAGSISLVQQPQQTADKSVSISSSSFVSDWTAHYFYKVGRIGSQNKFLTEIRNYTPNHSYDNHAELFEMSFDSELNPVFTKLSRTERVPDYLPMPCSDLGNNEYENSELKVSDGAVTFREVYSILKQNVTNITWENEVPSWFNDDIVAFVGNYSWSVAASVSAPVVGLVDPTDPVVIAATVSPTVADKFAKATVLNGNAVVATFSQTVDPRTTLIRTAGGAPLPTGSMLRLPKKDTYTEDDVAIYIKVAGGDDTYLPIPYVPPADWGWSGETAALWLLLVSDNS